MKKIKHTTWQLIAADHLESSVDEIQLLDKKSFRYQTLILMQTSEQIGLLKILPTGFKQSKLLELYDYENELIAIDALKRNCKLEFPTLIEHNTALDLLPNEYTFYQVPENNLSIASCDDEVLTQMKEWTNHYHSIKSSHFSLNIEEDDIFVSWAECFKYRWSILIDELEACQLINQKELDLSAQFFEAVFPTLTPDIKATFTNAGMLDQTILFNKGLRRIQPVDFTLCQWAPPEFSLTRSDYMQLGNWEPILKFKLLLNQSLELKARYFLYFISFALEDCLIHHLCAKSWENAIQRKKMAFTLMENALGS